MHGWPSPANAPSPSCTPFATGRLLLLPLLLAACSGPTPAPTGVDQAFEDAAREFEVPRDLLVAVSYALTRLDDRDGAESSDGAVGLMNLHITQASPSLADAALATGVDVDTLTEDPASNIRGGAALLAAMARNHATWTGERVNTYAEWYPIVSAYLGDTDPLVAEGFAAQVYDVLEYGMAVEASNGEWIEVAGQAMPWRPRDTTLTTGSSLIAQFVQASSSNYTNDSRGAGDIDRVVIHTMEGSYSGSISWFQNSAAQASAHYMVRSSDGQITQMLAEEDIGWHAGDWTTNSRSIGIEHEGYISAPDTWYTEAMMQASAALTADVCDRYGIPKDRSHIVGHNEVPGCSNAGGGGSSCHTDPGSGWDWDYYIDLVNNGSGGVGIPTSSLSDGAKTGEFEATVSSSLLGVSDTCSGAVSGTANNGTLYLTATCRLDQYGSRAGDVAVTFSMSASSASTLDGRVVVDGYASSFAGTINTDGSTYSALSGSQELGGDVGSLSYSATVRTDP